MNKVIILGLMTLVGACASVDKITTPPISVSYTDKAATQVSGFSDITFRAWNGKTRSGNELMGVNCSIKGSGFEARVVTPANIKLPVYRGRTKPIDVTCSYNGKTQTTRKEPFNATALKAGTAAGAGFGLIGALVTSAIVESSDNPKAEFLYHNIDVVFK